MHDEPQRTGPNTPPPRAGPDDGHRLRPARPGRGFLVVALALIVSAGVAVVVSSVVTRAESRFAGSTSNSGSFLESGDLQLELVADADGPEAERRELSMNAGNMLPGDVVQRCVVLGYTGSVDRADVRLFVRPDDQTGGIQIGDVTDVAFGDVTDHAFGGLAPFLDMTITVGSGMDTECSDFVVLGDRSNGEAATTADLAAPDWRGTLRELGRDHPDHARGIPVLVEASDGATSTVRVTVALRGDNRAQGQAAAFWLVFEVRP